ncbi:S-layer homology domain-containing protein [Paenibacillus lautus]|uniref:S-layer homology domain-containing protein n=1 Tax=Paenibacillus lautus TaxID=1401 RepID=UPI001C10B85B|nr:S-layer homology domain-containing protein [Paenibacillus lautus]MBU5349330.1 S-layer homology domain-containing protein [Paenibacillus lautus]
MKRITCSVLIALAASALYINSSDSVQADDGVHVSDKGRFDAQEAILRLTEGELHLGDGSGDIHLKAAISRQDFVIWIANALNLSTAELPEVVTFKDVPNDHYAFSAIEAAVHAGLVKGIGNERFGVGQSLTRQDMAVLYQRALQGITNKESSDGEAKQLELYEGSFSPYAKGAIKLAMDLGLFQESAAEAWNPKGIVTQEEAALLTVKWLKTVEHISSNTAEDEVETPPESPHPVIHGIVISSTGSTSTTPSVSGTAQSHAETENLASQPDLPTTAPTAPKDLKFRYEKGQIQLTWTAQQGETYNIYFSERSGTGYTLLTDGANVKSGSYVTSDVRFQETAYYVVEAVNSFGKSGYSNEVSSRPNKISDLQAILNEEDESIGLTWSDVQEGINYHVYYIGPDGVLYRLNDEPIESGTYLIPNRNMLAGPSGRYAIHVVAVNELNVSSEPSNEIVLDVKKDPEDRITITDPSVALPSEDLEEEAAIEQESIPEEYEEQE